MGTAAAKRGVDTNGSGGDESRSERGRAKSAFAFAEASEVEIAWAAGLYEGEGCCSVSRESKRNDPRYKGVHTYRYARISIASTDRDVLEEWQRIAGCGTITGPRIRRKPNHKPQWVFAVQNRRQVIEVISTLYPWLKERRREQALTVLAESSKSGSPSFRLP